MHKNKIVNSSLTIKKSPLNCIGKNLSPDKIRNEVIPIKQKIFFKKNWIKRGLCE